MRISWVRAACGSSLLLLASCVAAPEQRPASPEVKPSPPAASAPTVAPALVEWEYRPATAGNWTYRADGTGSAAIFASPSTGPALIMRCDASSRRVSLTRMGAAQASVTIRTSFGATTWPATAGPSGAMAVRAANDATLDQIAYSRGRFAVEIAGAPPLIVPAWGEVGRVIEDCRA